MDVCGWRRNGVGWYEFRVLWPDGKETWDNICESYPYAGSLYERDENGAFINTAFARFLGRPGVEGGENCRGGETITMASVIQQIERREKGERVASKSWVNSKNERGWLPPGIPCRVGLCARRWSEGRGYDLVAWKPIPKNTVVAHMALSTNPTPSLLECWCDETVQTSRHKPTKTVAAPTPTALGCLVNAAGVSEQANVRFGATHTHIMPIIATRNIKKNTVIRVSCRYFKTKMVSPSVVLADGRKTKRQRVAKKQSRSGNGRFA